MKKNQIILFFLPVIVVLFLIVGIIIFPQEAIKSAKEGLNIWVNVLIPSLLPFIIGANLIVDLKIVDLIGMIINPITKFIFNVSSVKLDDKAYIHWDKLPEGYKGIQEAFAQVGSGLSQTPEKVTTFQQNLDSLIPGLMGLLLTFACMWLLKKKVSPITIIIALFVIGVLAHVAGLMSAKINKKEGFDLLFIMI